MAAAQQQWVGKPFVWERYRKEAAAYKRITRRTRDDRAASAKHLLAGLGEQKPVEYLTLSDVERFVEMWRTGQGWPDGRTTPPVKPRTVASDLQVLRAVLLWATKVRLDDGSCLLRDYPLRGLKLPKEEDPRRPVAT